MLSQQKHQWQTLSTCLAALLNLGQEAALSFQDPCFLLQALQYFIFCIDGKSDL